MKKWLQVSSGRGPEECRWVVCQLTRYLMEEAQKHRLKPTLRESVAGSGGNTMSSALIEIQGDAGMVMPFVSEWQGTVQWIGRSMYRPGHKRKNWFVQVSAVDEPQNEQYNEQDIKVERMRASGPGGQHVNKTESAVRVTHIPSGLSAIAQEQRSQHANKELAIARLRDLIQQQNQETEIMLQQERWSRHNMIERGNATKVFTGRNFKLRKN